MYHTTKLFDAWLHWVMNSIYQIGQAVVKNQLVIGDQFASVLSANLLF